MASSQNGWSVITSSTSAALMALSWITGRVRAGDVWVIFDYLCRRFHAEVEPIVRAWSWGHAVRAVRGSTDTSNHASGTGLDLNAPRHVLGRRGTFTAAQVAAIRLILSALDGVVRWGGDYSGRADEMHFEINASPAAVSRVADRIRSGAIAVSNPSSSVGGGRIPTPHVGDLPTPLEEDDMYTDEDRKRDQAVAERLFGTGPDGLPHIAGTAQLIPLRTALEVLQWPVSRVEGAPTPLLQDLADTGTLVRKVLAVIDPDDDGTLDGPTVEFDEDAFAAAIAPRLTVLLPTALAHLSPEQVQEIARVTSDELARRLVTSTPNGA